MVEVDFIRRITGNSASHNQITEDVFIKGS